jgi:hypothetical protein
MRIPLWIVISSFMIVLSAQAKKPAAPTTIELPMSIQSAKALNTSLQTVAGHLMMQGNTVKIDPIQDVIHGLRSDGVRFKVLLSSESQRATIQCLHAQKRVLNRPSQKHHQNGRRFQMMKKTELNGCLKTLTASVKRSLAQLN